MWRGGLVHFRGRCENPLQLVDRVGIAWRNDQCSGEYRGSNPPTREVSGRGSLVAEGNATCLRLHRLGLVVEHGREVIDVGPIRHQVPAHTRSKLTATPVPRENEGAVL